MARGGFLTMSGTDAGSCLARMGELTALNFGIQLAGWGLASWLHTERFYDVFGSLTYWITVLRARSMASQAAGGADDDRLSTRQQVCTLCVLAWSARLGLFLAERAWKHGDSRFDKVKHQPKKFLIYWLVQGLWCSLIALPVNLQLTQGGPDSIAVQPADLVSWAGWLIGFTMETVADLQKRRWKAQGNQGFISTGLWKYSQHPNYFGEMLLWSSLCMSCITGLRGTSQKLLSMVSPAFTIFLLKYVSGIPLLKKAAMKKYGNDPDYLAYCARTNLLVPWLPRSGA